MDFAQINLKDYHYDLPEDRIAQHPLAERDSSKLLVYSKQAIQHSRFKKIGSYLPENSTLVFNDTKVIPARLQFQKETGAAIEIFLLQPTQPNTDINIAMQTTGQCTWSCMIGNLKRWKPDQLLYMTITVEGMAVTLTASQVTYNQVKLSWNPEEIAFVDIVKAAGQVPLPPYMKRKAEKQDRERYQTIYSKTEGAVAAPTAGLHFTDPILDALELQGIAKEYLTLHVGSGTFLPIKTDSIVDHPMHGEQISVTYQNICNLLESNSLISVGTTSLRTLESIYWFGVKLCNDTDTKFKIDKLAPYRDYHTLPEFRQSLEIVKTFMETKNLQTITGYTEIFIFPPYHIKSCHGLITNFHLPSSTLILLVAAFIGENWREIYQEALKNNYRFLSYGDTSLLLSGIHN